MSKTGIYPGTWRGLGATFLRRGQYRVVVTNLGAQLASLRCHGDPLEPMWQPPWPSLSPDHVGPEHGDLLERRLLGVICGSNLCLDGFGSPPPGNPRPLHGEAGIQTWHLDKQHDDGATFACHLPIARLWLRRRFSLTDDGVILSTTAIPMDHQPHQVEWCEHTTLDGNFLSTARIRAGIDRAWLDPFEEPTPRFSQDRLDEVDPKTALAIPGDKQGPCGDVVSGRVKAGWWSVDNPRLGWGLHTTFDPGHFRWLALWTEWNSRQGAPWAGKTRARGMEMSTKPFPEGPPPVSRAQHFHGTPTTCPIPVQGTTTVIHYHWSPLTKLHKTHIKF